jgi:hypothetical protein
MCHVSAKMTRSPRWTRTSPRCHRVSLVS